MPVVFAAHGLTLTAAFELSLALRHPAGRREGEFGLVETVVGLTPSMGGPQRLAERAGPARARELIFTGERYPAAVSSGERRHRVLPTTDSPRRRRRTPTSVAAGPTARTRPRSGWSRPRSATAPGGRRLCRRSRARCSAPRTSAARWRVPRPRTGKGDLRGSLT